MRKALTYGAGLIALYLIVAHGSGFGTAVTGLGTAATKVTTGLQGR